MADEISETIKVVYEKWLLIANVTLNLNGIKKNDPEHDVILNIHMQAGKAEIEVLLETAKNISEIIDNFNQRKNISNENVFLH